MRSREMWCFAVAAVLAGAGSWGCGSVTHVDGDADSDIDEDTDHDADQDEDAACPPNVFDLEGAPCEFEGLSCGGPCTDSCSFCNLIACMGGNWTSLEAFPMPCFVCGHLQCIQITQYCEIARSDVLGEPDDVSCNALPPGCNEPSCECLGTTVTYDNCTDENGQVTIEHWNG